MGDRLMQSHRRLKVVGQRPRVSYSTMVTDANSDASEYNQLEMSLTISIIIINCFSFVKVKPQTS